MPFNCSYFIHNEIDEPNVGDHIQGSFYFVIIILRLTDLTYLNVFTALGAFGIAFAVFGSVSTITLIILFILSIYQVIKKSPPQWRRLLTWIISMPMIVSVLSMVTFIVPGAAILCDTVKQS